MSEPARTALVTGAANGIGAAVARRLVREGWTVYGLDRDGRSFKSAEEAQFPVPSPSGRGGRFVPLDGDVSSEGDIAEAIGRIRQDTGRLHGLVSNAGIMVRKPLAQLTLEDWNRVIATNLTALMLLAREAAPLLRGPGGEDAVNRGSIVAIASTRAYMSEPDTESYAASKGGLVALTHALAVSLGPLVRVNCISPGWIDVGSEPLRPEDHAQHPAGRVGRPDDIAGLASWLLGPESGFVTGAEFVSDGGMTRRMIYAE